MSANHIIRIIPVLKINNRHLNQEFFVNQLGMKALLEEAAFLSLGDQTKTEKLQLEESPSMRSRRVKGPKKLARIVVKVADAKEIESLLAQKPAWTKLYQGEKGYAFEAYMQKRIEQICKKSRRILNLKSKRTSSVLVNLR